MTGITTKPEHGSVEWRGPPTSFDGFVVDRVLGKGGMGDVYLGRDTTLDRQVALKFISAPEPSPQARGRFLVEARAIAKLSHPNVVAVFSVGEVEGRPYIAYEFVEGQSLERLVKPVPWETALRIAVGLTAGLEAAHREGILHRDIKPSNVVLSERGEVKLLDFGLAKLRGGFDEPPELVSGEGSTVSARAIQKPATRSITEQTRNITKQGTIMGTPAYLAPELWWGEAATTRSDVWALGLVLYDLLFGKLPHADLHGDELTFAIIDRDLPSIRTARPDVPASFADIIERCLRREADERFSSADELAKAMRDVSGVFLPLTGSLGAVQLEPERLAVAASLARMSTQMRPLTALLYERLFAEHPSVRTMFPENMAALQDKLAHALKLAISGLVDPERLAPVLEDLGRRHARYGVLVEHFDALQGALLGALAQVDAANWNPTLERGWKRAYAFIEGAMRRGLVAPPKTAVSHAVVPNRQPAARTKAPAKLLEIPKARYATSGELSIAHHVFGQGKSDLVVMLGAASHGEIAWQEPLLASFLGGLAGFARVITFDPRGTGMSDRDVDALSADAAAVDLAAVLDAAGSNKPVLLGLGEGARAACLFASSRPDRVRRLVLYGASARSFPRAEAPFAHDAAALTDAITTIRASWGEAVFAERDAPTMAKDVAFDRWLALFLRQSASPGTMVALLKRDALLDLTDVLPKLTLPVLVLHRTGDRTVPIAAARDLAAKLPDATFIELEGNDHLAYVADASSVLAEVEGFVGARD